MADLHPEVEKKIKAGPLVSGRYTQEQYETIEEFARRIAALAVKKEREECAKVCESRAGSGPYAESMGAYRILTSAADAIRRRGKP